MRRMQQNGRSQAMMGFTALGGAFALATLAVAGPAVDGDLDRATLESMSSRLAELEARNQALQGRVNELEAVDGQDWLTEQRASQIRGVVTDVLADAETRVSLQDGGMTAGWDGGFFLASPDGRFRLNVGGMLQTRFIWGEMSSAYVNAGRGGQENEQADQVTSRSGFDIPQARLEFSGHVFGATTFRVSGNFANTRNTPMEVYGAQFPASNTPLADSGVFHLLDAWVGHEFDENFSVRVGQFKLPFDRGWEVPVKYQLTGQRDAVAQHFGLGRSQGVELRWVTDQARLRFAFSDGAADQLFYGLYLDGTNPKNSPWNYQQSSWAVSARGEWNIAGRWSDFARMTSLPGDDLSIMIGGGVHAQENKNYWNQNAYVANSQNNSYNQWLAATADVTVNFGGASITGAFYYHNVRSNATTSSYDGRQVGDAQNPAVATGTTQMIGVSLFGSMYVSNNVELFAGWQYMDVLSGLDTINTTETQFLIYQNPGAFNSISLGTNWYIDGEDMKFTFAFDYMPSEVAFGWSTPSNGVRGTPGSNQFVLRTQLQLLF